MNYIHTQVDPNKMDQPYWGKKDDENLLLNVGFVIGKCSQESGGPSYRYDWHKEKRLHVNFGAGYGKAKKELLVKPPDDDQIPDYEKANPPIPEYKSAAIKCAKWKELTTQYRDTLPVKDKEMLIQWANEKTPSDKRQYARKRLQCLIPSLGHNWGTNTPAGPYGGKWTYKWCTVIE
jgi:hypothetical protein